MAVTGRKPKDEKVTRHPLSHDWTEVDDRPYTGPKKALPKKLPAETRAWYADISRMPHCVLWTATDWRFAVDTARVHAAFIGGDMARAAELRVREAKMGTTMDALRDLRIRYREPLAKDVPTDETETAAPAEDAVDFAAERRKRLTGAG
jgi:hypothetical protein